jgi:hypothetical protein
MRAFRLSHNPLYPCAAAYSRSLSYMGMYGHANRAPSRVFPKWVRPIPRRSRWIQLMRIAEVNGFGNLPYLLMGVLPLRNGIKRCPKISALSWLIPWHLICEYGYCPKDRQQTLQQPRLPLPSIETTMRDQRLLRVRHQHADTLRWQPSLQSCGIACSGLAGSAWFTRKKLD